jgi:PAS domain S-box-containing protein
MEHQEQQWSDWRNKVIGLGEQSSRKNYYPELQKRLQELKESEADLLMLFNSVNAAIFILDMDGRLQDVNETMLSMYHVTREQALSFTIADYCAPGPQLARLPATLKAASQSNSRTRLEGQARRPLDNSFFDAELTVQCAPWRNRPMMVAIVLDVTERKQAERKRLELEQQLAQAQKMESVGRLAGGVAHDFNNMLQVIIGNTSMALDELPPDSPVREHLEETLKSAQRSADLTRQLLAFARKQTIRPKILDLNETVQGMLKMLRRLIGENIELVWIPGASLWPVKMDPSQLDQILANLCVNARDAIISTGRVSLETSNTSLDGTYFQNRGECVPGDYVMLAVSDTGRGMDSVIQSHLFEPFFTTKALGEGTGLGLATVFGIVKQNDGLINVYSEPNCGTTFKIYLPRVYQESAPASAEQAARSQSPRGTETILLVEDEVQILGLGRRILEQHGYTVLTASTPEGALGAAADHAGPIHLLVTDVVMPKLNGKELMELLLGPRPELKCLFMSGYTSDVIAHHGVLEHGLQFLQKPFSIQSLTRKVRETLDQQ